IRPYVENALIACILQINGIWWLAKRTETPLQKTLLYLFNDVSQKLQAAGQALAPVEGKPTNQSLADELRRA
ncbi:DUF412 family protein, partial [Erwinia amylovora]|uniref:DUF412 family protein n=1 Tax=Erwinia amylovora TaxID=552 RepID=UPI0020C030CC